MCKYKPVPGVVGVILPYACLMCAGGVAAGGGPDRRVLRLRACRTF